MSQRASNPVDGEPARAERVRALADGADLEMELERHEQAELLDHAMALLPPDSRLMLVERFINESPYAEIAQRLRLSEGTVKVKVHRGKLALRRLLAGPFQEDARSYGLLPAGTGEWEDTPLWCSFCGEQRLQGRLRRDTPAGEFSLRCPRCLVDTGMMYHNSDAHLLGQVSRYKAALSRVMVWVDAHYRAALRRGVATCCVCGRQAPLHMGLPEDLPPPAREMRGLHIRCTHCGTVNVQSIEGLVLSLPQGQRFHRDNPRIRTLPLRELEAAGRPAIVASFQSVRSGAMLDVISARDTYEVLAIHTAPGA